MHAFRTYLQSIENFFVFQYISQGHSSRISGREPQQPRSHVGASTVPMSGRKSRTLELLAFDEKSNFDCLCFIWPNKASLALYAQIKQKQSKVDFFLSKAESALVTSTAKDDEPSCLLYLGI